VLDQLVLRKTRVFEWRRKYVRSFDHPCS
jgi:hypothetical protein